MDSCEGEVRLFEQASSWSYESPKIGRQVAYYNCPSFLIVSSERGGGAGLKTPSPCSHLGRSIPPPFSQLYLIQPWPCSCCPSSYNGNLVPPTQKRFNSAYLQNLICIFITTRRYGPLRGPTSSSCGGLRPSAEAFFALLAKKKNYYAVLAHFQQFLVSSSNIGNF